VQGNAECDTVDGQYDFILAKDLIEHLDDDGPFFRRLGAQLKPGGYTYLATQNDHSLNYLLEGTYERRYRGNPGWYGWDRTHRRFYNAPVLARQMHAVGIAPVRWGSSYLVPWRFVTKRLTGKVRPWKMWSGLDMILGTTSPFARWGWSIMVVGRKAS
jgi:2-polyprenyl-6-hydroxyphenyl methylase/3-demethylubiquinone-9 3-methyltransferase